MDVFTLYLNFNSRIITWEYYSVLSHLKTLGYKEEAQLEGYNRNTTDNSTLS